MFSCPDQTKAAVWKIMFHLDVTCIRVYVTFGYCNQSPTNIYVYIQIYIEIYVCVTLGCCNNSIFYPRKLKFGMHTLTFNFVLKLPLGHALGWGYESKYIMYLYLTLKFTMTFTSAILLEVISWVPFMLGC